MECYILEAYACRHHRQLLQGKIFVTCYVGLYNDLCECTIVRTFEPVVANRHIGLVLNACQGCGVGKSHLAVVISAERRHVVIADLYDVITQREIVSLQKIGLTPGLPLYRDAWHGQGPVIFIQVKEGVAKVFGSHGDLGHWW